MAYIPPQPDYTVEARGMFTGTTTAGRSIIAYTQRAPTTSYSDQIRTDAAGHFVNYTFDGRLNTITGTYPECICKLAAATVSVQSGKEELN